jgi:hypothetical protein
MTTTNTFSLSREDMHRFRQNALIGIESAQSNQPLQTLAIAAAESRFRLPQDVDLLSVSRLEIEQGAFLPHQARRLLRRLVGPGDGSVDDHVSAATPYALRRAGWRLHPFDFAHLEGYLARHAASFGHNERQWLSLVRPEKPQTEENYWDGPRTEEFLPKASKGQKISYLTQVRGSDPGRARELIAQLIPNEDADSRGRLLRVLSMHLSVDDRDFLQGFDRDRAPSVKQVAQGLLARLPGSENEAHLVKLIQDYIVIKTEGLLKRSKVLVYQGPTAPSGEPEHQRWSALTAALTLQAMVTALGQTPESLIDMSSTSGSSPQFLPILTRIALHEGRLALFSRGLNAANDNLEAVLDAIFDHEFTQVPREHRQHAVRVCVTQIQQRVKPLGSSLNVSLVYRMLHAVAGGDYEPLPDDIGQTLLDALLAVKEFDGVTQQTMIALSSLLSVNLSEQVIKACEETAPRAALFHRFLLNMATSKT